MGVEKKFCWHPEFRFGFVEPEPEPSELQNSRTSEPQNFSI